MPYRKSIEYKRRYNELTKELCYEMIEWLKTHDGKKPSKTIRRNGVRVPDSEFTEDEKKGRRLYSRWTLNLGTQMIDRYLSMPIEEVPEEFRELVTELKKYTKSKKTIFEEIVEWISKHNGAKPRAVICKNGKTLTIDELTEEEKVEVRLRARWDISKEKELLDDNAEKTIEEIREEEILSEDDIDKIIKLRELGQMGKNRDDKIKERMKKAVRKGLEDNSEVRREMESEEHSHNAEDDR